MFAARERGIHFDLGHGAGSFWFRNAVPAFRGGFPPDTISTDLHMGNINGPVVGMLNTMSKFLSMGMPLEEVIRRSTVEPARVIRRPALGTLSAGAEADVAVFRAWRGVFGFADCGKAKMTGTKKLECQLTLRAGQIVYDPMRGEYARVGASAAVLLGTAPLVKKNLTPGLSLRFSELHCTSVPTLDTGKPT